MCDPVTLTVLTVGTTLLGAYSQVQQGKQDQAWSNYQAAQTDADARTERSAAQVEAERIRKLGKRQAAEAEATFAGSGVDINSGSALDINRDITAGAEEDASLAILGGNDRAARLNQQATADRLGGASARRAGNINATTTLLQGAASVSKGWKPSKSVTKPGGK